MKLLCGSIQPANHMSATPVKAFLATSGLSHVCFPKSRVGQVPLQPGAVSWGMVWFPCWCLFSHPSSWIAAAAPATCSCSGQYKRQKTKGEGLSSSQRLVGLGMAGEFSHGTQEMQSPSVPGPDVNKLVAVMEQLAKRQCILTHLSVQLLDSAWRRLQGDLKAPSSASRAPKQLERGFGQG